MDKWPKKLMLRDAELYNDLGGGGQRIFTTAGFGYEKRDYYSSDYVIELRQRIEALEAAAQNVCGVAEKAHNASEVYQAILELKAALLPGRSDD